ncbi:MAG: UDP-2,3-diacylglucosamine diphosphatase [Aliidiomarina sp.]|uniref:UDP-2,3-diacylglucosamine diphosphatase n=1 Tax=Aliidiomarina sp. TaxID=1872439 RepID=UPI0025C60F09|nr:UDP-2,3-diacylglucosamine diphosphatase [Aliidiomarina sp.]MCH8501399.1 UDP-2,3-diacylglucosamine diphosphatase [Aliidiomarina sp.]
MTTLFISDLHLSAERPDISGLFIEFLQTQARHAEALYILGDLFEYWIGDDDHNEFHCLIESELKALTAAGVPCFFMHGNRDFLVGADFAQRTGITLLPEPTTVEIYSKRIVLLHGDTLCTDDVAYQRFRRVIRNPWLLGVARRLPLSWRRAIATKLRDSSSGNSAEQKPLTPEQLDQYDAKSPAIENLLAATRTDLMIHGHTHRPNVHTHIVNGVEKKRIVLGDWYEQGSILEFNSSDFELKSQSLHRTTVKT